MNKIELINAVMYSELSAEFEVLPHHERFNLRRGDSVQICVSFPENIKNIRGERFWVLITDSDNGNYRGIITNKLLNTAEHGLVYEDSVEFSYRNIYRIAAPREVSEQSDHEVEFREKHLRE